MSEEISVRIARVRRLMPRNGEVMAICEEVERLQGEARELRKQLTAATAPVDRKAYMRDYMAKRRKKLRGGQNGKQSSDRA